MDSIIYRLLHEWPGLEKELSDQLHGLPDYAKVDRELDKAIDQLEHALGDDPDGLYLRFEEADNAMASLCSTAAFLCGFRFCARLLTEIVTS